MPCLDRAKFAVLRAGQRAAGCMDIYMPRCTCGVSSLAAIEAQQVTGANDGVSELLMPSTAATSN